MKTLFTHFIFTLIGAMLACSQATASSEMHKVASFAELHKIVKGLGRENQKHTLLVMDDDDTLTMMSCPDHTQPETCQYLGGPAWYAWQNSLIGTGSPYRVAVDSHDLLEISALLLSMNKMLYTEYDVPEKLRELTESGVRLLVETARGSSNLSATVSQFENLPVKSGSNSESFLDLIRENALVGKESRQSSIASPFHMCVEKLTRPISYQQGVMYVAGQDKGVSLKCFLERTESSSIKYIVFIDDTLENVKNVYRAFKGNRHIDVKALHYTALQDHKAALTEGDMAATYQGNAHNRWNSIKNVMELELQKPAFPR